MKTLEFKPYFFEPLRSMEKRATIRKSDEGLKKGDIVECAVKGSIFCYPDICDDTVLFQIIFEIPTRGLNDLKLRRI